MLCIFKGKETERNDKGTIVVKGRHAGEIRDDIIAHVQLPNPETDRGVQCRKEGLGRLTYKQETSAEAIKRIGDEHTLKHLPFDPTTVTAQDLQETVDSERIDPAPMDVFISPNLKKADGSPVTLADFPDGFRFGNGTTANVLVPFKDLSAMYLTWCVFPVGTNLTPTHKNALHSIVTGQ